MFLLPTPTLRGAVPRYELLLFAGLPGAPSNLTATAASATQINLTWTDGATNESGFKIESCQGNSCTNFAEIGQVAANTTSFPSSGLLRKTW